MSVETLLQQQNEILKNIELSAIQTSQKGQLTLINGVINDQSMTAGAAFWTSPYVIPADGALVIVVAIDPDYVGAVLSTTLDGSTYYGLNSGSPLSAGALYEFAFRVSQNDQVNFHVDTSTQIGVFRAFFQQS